MMSRRVATPAQAPPAPPSVAILVVAGQESDRLAQSAALEDAGYRVHVAGTGRAALDLLDRELIDLVLIDGRLTEPGSPDVLARLRQHPPAEDPLVQHASAEDAESEDARATDGLPEDALAEDALAEDPPGEGAERDGAQAEPVSSAPLDADELLTRIRAAVRDKVAWDANVARLRARALVADIVAGAAGQGPRNELGRRICADLADRGGYDGAMIVAFLGRRALGVVGSHGRFDEPDTRARFASPDLATRLHDHATRGPSIIDAEAGGVALDAFRSELTVALAPIANGERLWGALLLGLSTGGDPWAERGEALATAIEFAEVVEGVFGGALISAPAAGSRRVWLDRLLDPTAFTPHFQPIMELATNRTIGYEALTRWHDRTDPESVVLEAHRLGLGDEVEIGLARAAIEHARDLPRGAYLALNFSLSTLLTRPDLAVLLPHDRPTVIEITENERVSDYDALRRALDRLGPLTEVAVDDAGAGYASLRHILAVRPRCVKLDIYWITDIDADPARQAVLAGLVHFANRLGCCLVAEGIERQSELLALKLLGITHGQGRLLGRPSPASTYAVRPALNA
jgi:EAL domain-containing protein (putative c-di-GMP-specific phosphodiesterase class I)/CheY-like chemotaxis protein